MTAPSRVLTASRTLTAVKGKALYHDGIDDYVSIPDDPSLDITNAITFEAWVNLNPKSSYYGIASKGYSWNFEWYSGGWMSELYIDGNWRNCAWFTFTNYFGKWAHLVLTYDSDTHYCKKYLNGNLVKANEFTDLSDYKIGSSSYSVQIGMNTHHGLEHANGTIALVRIYERALSAAEVLYNKEHPYNPILHGCVLWLGHDSIDEGAGIWRDKSGYNNDGVVYGATAVEMNKLAGRVLSV